LNSPSPQVRASAAKSLGDFGNPKAISYLMKLFDDPDIFVLESVIEALGNLEAIEAVPKIIHNLKTSPDYGIRKVAAEALIKIGTDEAFEAVKEQYEQETNEQFKKYLRNLLKSKKLI